ncbi:MAG: glycosyltransferase family 4 protein [Anaerolineales bacterium]|nr:glycosyltransferase family 4 protein [Anaerolineales bacterium]
MRIVINAQLLSDAESYRGAGVSNYARRLLSALGELLLERHSTHRLSAYVHAHRITAPGIDLIDSPEILERPMARIAWEQTALPLELRRQRANLVHGLVNVLPLATATPGIVTVHDLSFLRTPERLPPLKRTYLTALCRVSVQRAAKVIAVSRQTAGDVTHFFGTPPEKIEVVYNGVAPEFQPIPNAAATRLRSDQNRPERYLLYLGTLEPRKNLELLIRAFGRWRQSASAVEREIVLVLAGARGWYYDTIFEQVTALGLADSVQFPGFIPAAQLPDWYRGAEGFVYPSVFEGFGLPVLEAMACGTPVLCSHTPSLLEVAGDATLTFDPTAEEELLHGLQLLLGQPALRAELRARGMRQAGEFSWHRCAEATLRIYEAVGVACPQGANAP